MHSFKVAAFKPVRIDQNQATDSGACQDVSGWGSGPATANNGNR
jgi:hypothetical protein